MEGFVQNFQDLKIELEVIKKATNDFDQKNFLGGGGFGNVYKGELAQAEGQRMVAIKRLDRKHGQGEAEFMKEIDTLSRYKHENLISLMGFCYQEDEAFIVYELASNGSLDKHLNSRDLTWSKRIKICLDAAKGLRYLHDPRGTHQRVIHCDIKGGNILLDDHWNGKIADFGFSITGPANNGRSAVITLAAGTLGYIDPLYQTTNMLTKESDVYSFGVVLFEVLLGRLCYIIDSNGDVNQILVPKWKEYYEDKTLNDRIFNDPAIQPLEQNVLKRFSDIAYRCLKESRQDRPEMADVVKELETALEIHMLLQNQEFRANWNEQSFTYKKMAESAEPSLKYTSEDELKNLLSEGVLLNGGNTWFSLNKKGEHCEMISFAECLGSNFMENGIPIMSRFPRGAYLSASERLETSVKTQFLSPGITYTVNFIFKFYSEREARRCECISLKYKLQGEKESSISYLAHERKDEWWTVELYQFTCDHRIFDLQIVFDGHVSKGLLVEGIEFLPLEKMEHNEDENQPISYSGAYREERLPTDYEDILKMGENAVQWTTKEEAYSIMSKGFLISDGRKNDIWFSLDKNGKKCLMLSANAVKLYGKSLPLLESRFGEAIQRDYCYILLDHEVQSQLISPQTTYAIYLVYKLSKDQSGFETPMRVEGREYLSSGDKKRWYIYLVSPQTPVIKTKAGQNTHNPAATKLIKENLPQQRNDGWMEVQLLEFLSDTTEMTFLDLYMYTTEDSEKKKKFRGLIVEGIEIRPV